MQAETLRLHRFQPSSQANGPGNRAVIWVQGCALGCPGCFNPDTHDFYAGEEWEVSRLAQEILQIQDQIEGLSISGGEPVHQHRGLARLFEIIRSQSHLSVLVFSGYDREEMARIPGIQAFLAGIDVLIAGRYLAKKRVARSLLGSNNKTVHYLTGRYSAKDLEEVPQAEILITPDGEIILSGIDPLSWIPSEVKD